MENIKFGFTPTHPGEVLKDEIEYRKISQKKTVICFHALLKYAR
jgi:plasmid maintenance system antidote protein VapI